MYIYIYNVYLLLYDKPILYTQWPSNTSSLCLSSRLFLMSLNIHVC